MYIDGVQRVDACHLFDLTIFAQESGLLCCPHYKIWQ